MRRTIPSLVVCGCLTCGVLGFYVGASWSEAALPSPAEISSALLREAVANDEPVEDPGLLDADVGRIAESWFHRWRATELDVNEWHLRVTYLQFTEEGETLVPGHDPRRARIGDSPVGVMASPTSLVARIRMWLGLLQ